MHCWKIKKLERENWEHNDIIWRKLYLLVSEAPGRQQHFSEVNIWEKYIYIIAYIEAKCARRTPPIKSLWVDRIVETIQVNESFTFW